MNSGAVSQPFRDSVKPICRVYLARSLSSPRSSPSTPSPPSPPAFPERPPADPASLERGKAVYGVHCTFCHGVDARGGSGGPNLIRTSLVLNDRNGELIGPVIREGREGMPKFDLNPTQISDIAAFIHNFKVGGYDISRNPPPPSSPVTPLPAKPTSPKPAPAAMPV